MNLPARPVASAFTAAASTHRKGATGPTWSPPPAEPKPRPQRRYLGYQPGHARLRRRLGALIVDGFVCAPFLIPCVLLMGGLGRGAWLVYLAACLIYFFLLELHTGQTIGKRVAGLRVVRVDGRPVDVMGIGARNALRLIDGIPGPPLIGALSMTLTGQRRRRIGDLAAGTIVVEADEHAFVRGPWSPLIVVYPILWLGLAVGGGLLAEQGQGEPYLADVDAVCHARVDASHRAASSFQDELVLSHHETRLIAALPYPSRLSSTRQEILALKQRVDTLADSILRDAKASRDPQRTFESERPQLQAVAAQVNARFDQLGLHYCAQ
jgi:uncharacterized RDD family membrane protein YckC